MMLTEFGLTPQIFDANTADANWRKHLLGLAHGIFPRDRTQPVPVIVANFQAGRWFAEAVSIIKGIRSMEKRIDAEKLLTKLKDIVVDRPAVGTLPTSEAKWLEEAFASHRTAPFTRLLATNGASNGMTDPGEILRRFAEVDIEEFRDGLLPSHEEVRPVLGEQIKALSSLCLHASFLAFASPYMRDDRGDDLAFTVGLMRQAICRPKSFSRPVVLDVHTEARSSPGSSDFATVLEREADHIWGKLPAEIRGTGVVRLFMWPRLFERVLIAGTSARCDKGQLRLRARWAVKFSHVARPSDRHDGETNTLTLMAPAARDERYGRLYEKQIDGIWPKVFSFNRISNQVEEMR